MTVSEENQAVQAMKKVIYFALGEPDGWVQSRPSRTPDAIPESVRDSVLDIDEYFRDGLSTRRTQVGPFHLLEVRLAPNFIIPRHHHNLDQMVLLMEGAARQGRRWFYPGDGYFTRAFTPYTTAAGPEGCRVVEVRKDPIEELEIQWDEDKPERWQRSRWEEPTQD
jgi:hypothetical protein